MEDGNRPNDISIGSPPSLALDFEQLPSPSVQKRPTFAAQELILPAVSGDRRWDSNSSEVPDWVSDLRKVWNEEIAHMDSNKAGWFLEQQQAIFDMESSGGLDSFTDDMDDFKLEKLSPEPRKRVVDRVLEVLRVRKSMKTVKAKKFHQSVKQELQQVEKKIVALSERRKELTKRSKFDLEKWESWAVDNLVAAGRTYYETKMLYLDTRLEIEVYRAVELRRVAAMDKEEIEAMNMVHPAKWVLPEKYELLSQSCGEMEKLLDELLVTFQEVKQEYSRPLRSEEIKNKLLVLLMDAAIRSVECPDFGMYFHSMEQEIQPKFNRLLLDERSTEGQWLKKWKALLNSNVEKATPSAITAFIKNFIKFLMKTHSFEPVDLLEEIDTEECVMVSQPLGLYLERMIFQRIGKVLHSFKGPLEDERALKWHAKMSWLRSLSQSDIGIDMHLQKPACIVSNSLKGEGSLFRDEFSGLAFENAMRHFHGIEAYRFPTPVDVVYYCVCLIQNITDDARAYNKSPEFVINADVLVPIVEWVLIHANLSRIDEIIAHAIRFLGKQRYFGFGGFCISQVEIAIDHILTMETSSFDLPAETERAPSRDAVHRLNSYISTDIGLPSE